MPDLPFVIVAGGKGTRMRPLTERVPKALLTVAGVPLLDLQLDWLRKQGVRRVVVCLGHLSEPIESHLATTAAARGLDIAISLEGDSCLGTAGAVRLAIERGLLGDRFLTLYGDTIPSLDLAAAMEHWNRSGAPALLCVYPASGQPDEARALVHSGRVTRFSRHPLPGEVESKTHGDYGVAGFHSSQFAHLLPWVRGGFGTIHADLARRGDLVAYDVGAGPLEVGTMDGYKRAELIWASTASSNDGISSSNR